jgi:phosphoglycolate phosphatase-like HAD superfamily hydrolase
MKINILVLFLLHLVLISCKQESATRESSTSSSIPIDPLPSWNEGPSKKSITDFITKTTTESSADFIPISDRIACFDNDGTLWSEQPLYFQFIFALDRVKELAPQHPEWKTKEPFSFLLKGDMKSALAGGEKSLMQIIAATQTGMSSEEFDTQTKNWIANAKHSKFNRPYTEMIYQPMLELLNYLRANNYKTFIVSGGEEGFMCAWVEKTYGIPCEQVIGTLMRSTYEVVNDTPRIVRKPELDLMNDGKGKPVGIYNQIGKRPVFTAGNSDGDYEMLQWTTTASGYPRFGMIVHHTDSVREWAYDRTSHIGHLERGLDDATKYNWLIVDMRSDWKEVFKKTE